jgi:2-(1,2-epoxy-1,2-dihydrophenyl)acetyl-CoA isomerase
MATPFNTIMVDAEGGVMTITLNRPDVLNALNEQMSTELSAALRSAEREKSIRCIVLTGAGRAFCAGLDLRTVYEKFAGKEPQPMDYGGLLRQRYNPIINRLRALEKPVIAAVNGVAAGGGLGLALACDLRICAGGAFFKAAFAEIGLILDMGATLTLLRSIGYARTAELYFMGDKLPADEALNWGLANRVVDDAHLEATVSGIAHRIAQLPAKGLGLTKRALNRAWTASLEDQLEYEAFLQETAGLTPDHREGVLAFAEKRPPKFE